MNIFGRLARAFGMFRPTNSMDIFSDFMQRILNTCLTSTIYTTVLNALIPVGVALCVLFCLLELMDKVATVQYSTETFIHQMFKFLIAYALVTNIPEILVGFSSFVTAINTTLASAVSSHEMFNEIIEGNNNRTLMSLGTIQNLNNALASIFSITSFLMNLVAMFSIATISIRRAIIICVKGALAPLAVPDVYKNGLSSSGMKFLRGLFANYLEATVVLIVIQLCCIVCRQATTISIIPIVSIVMSISNLLVSIVCLFIVRGSLNKVPQYAQEIMM